VNEPTSQYGLQFKRNETDELLRLREALNNRKQEQVSDVDLAEEEYLQLEKMERKFKDWLMADVWTALPLMALGVALLLSTGRALDALTLGENGAKSLGINLLRLQWVIVLGVGLAVGASVAVSGVVGFVGLIVPHLIRAVYGEQPSKILLPSALGGAILTLTADSLVRLVPGPGEVRLGIAMAVLGAPFFLLLLLRYRKGAV
jgi:iron complex transport system permease protein